MSKSAFEKGSKKQKSGRTRLVGSKKQCLSFLFSPFAIGFASSCETQVRVFPVNETMQIRPQQNEGRLRLGLHFPTPSLSNTHAPPSKLPSLYHASGPRRLLPMLLHPAATPLSPRLLVHGGDAAERAAYFGHDANGEQHAQRLREFG